MLKDLIDGNIGLQFENNLIWKINDKGLVALEKAFSSEENFENTKYEYKLIY